MTDATNYLKDEVIRWIVGGEDMPTAHGNVYVGLHTGPPGDDAQNNEVTASGYSRADTIAGNDWDVSTVGQFENTSDILFDEAEENWGDISHFSIWDGSSDTDNALGISELEATRTIEAGDSAVFRQGRLSGELL
jgi:hypothetical protein